MIRRILLAALLLIALGSAGLAADAIPPIPRVLPPEGLEIPADVRTRLETRLIATEKRTKELASALNADPYDIEVFTKAVELALAHREFYVEKDFEKADWALDEANKRLEEAEKGNFPWIKATGLVVHGCRSSIDGSAQPYGLVVPKDHDFGKRSPVYFFLHGRGDKNTDLHFIYDRATKVGQIAPANAIVVHPFGRHCVGWKHAGEIDVIDVLVDLVGGGTADPERIVLMGFSMGGAGAWHIGAHYTDRWVAVSPGAGFVDTARYQNITPDKYLADYVQKLWGLYDVPDYVRNLFNTSVIAYSGELDKQRQAAVFMEEAFKSEGRTLTHLIGPGVEHKYEPETLKELMRRLDALVAQGRTEYPPKVELQTRTLRYNRQAWVEALGLEEHWRDSRVTAECKDMTVEAKTRNIRKLGFSPSGGWSGYKYVIDGQPLGSPTGIFAELAVCVKENGKWRWGQEGSPHFEKSPGLQGPIDDAFMNSFLVVAPTGKSRNSAFQTWCEFELAHFKDRWRALMRGELPVKLDADVTPSDWEEKHEVNLVLFGDADSNSVIRRLADRLPVKFLDGKWTLGTKSFDGNTFAPALIYPYRADVPRYLVLNSGLTFREGHDRTNSQQNPKLPDWAIIDITQPPDAYSPGRIHDAGFFDEQWQLKNPPKGP